MFESEYLLDIQKIQVILIKIINVINSIMTFNIANSVMEFSITIFKISIKKTRVLFNIYCFKSIGLL